MNNDETKKKVVEVLFPVLKGKRISCNEENACKQCWFPCEVDRLADSLADALIAVGIGDVSCLREHRVIAEYSLVPDDGNPYIIPNVPLRVTQLYSGEEVEKIVKERRELKDELRSKVEYIQEQDEVIKKYKHRAEIAERALRVCAESAYAGNCEDCCYFSECDTSYNYCLNMENAIKNSIAEAEKELAEERKDENN